MMAEKKCSKCGKTKLQELFTKDKSRKDGLFPWCKQCNANHVAAYKSKNPESFKRWYEKNADKKRAKTAAWRLANVDRIKKYRAIYARLPETLFRSNEYKKKVGYNAKRRAIELQAKTEWCPEFDELVVLEAYALARLRTNLFGFKWHVDHIVPLAGKTVRGFHNAYNLQVIPGKQNLTKNNCVWPYMW